MINSLFFFLLIERAQLPWRRRERRGKRIKEKEVKTFDYYDVILIRHHPQYNQAIVQSLRNLAMGVCVRRGIT